MRFIYYSADWASTHNMFIPVRPPGMALTIMCKSPLPKRWLVATTPRGKSDKTRWAEENTLEHTSLRVQITLRLTSLTP